MIRFIRSHFIKHTQEVKATIKLVEVEERFDLAFSRFFGLYFAKLGKSLHMTPTQISIISLVFGMAGGYMLFFQSDWVMITWASFFIVLAGVLDSADGQLARMTGRSTVLGRFIDGFIDSAVFFTCYLAASTHYVQGAMGWSIFLLAIPAGFISHIFASQVYDFYKCEFLYYVARSETSKVQTLEEVKANPVPKGFWNKFFRMIQIDYTKRQWLLVSRSEKVRLAFETAAFSPTLREQFVEKYRATFKPMLFWWALLAGTNTHRTLILLFSIMGRFDLYLIVCLIKIIPLAVLMVEQKLLDDDFQKQFKLEPARS